MEGRGWGMNRKKIMWDEWEGKMGRDSEEGGMEGNQRGHLRHPLPLTGTKSLKIESESTFPDVKFSL